MVNGFFLYLLGFEFLKNRERIINKSIDDNSLKTTDLVFATF
jgi:hypothetical protein